MRINSYNKFFAKVAKIMNTSVKAVKPIDGRYKVELANHVYLDVYRGVVGCLFIHDHRGISHITSCYDFEDFKTMKDLYERLVSDYSESAKKDVMEVRQESNSRLGIEMTHCVRKNTENYLKAVKNPNWHHVSLGTLANIDNDMLDEKRRHYMKVYRMSANVINSIYKCNKLTSIDKLRTNLIQTVRTMAKNEKIEWALVQYVKAKIDNCYLVNGLQSSFYSKTYGYNKSRSYTKTFFI